MIVIWRVKGYSQVMTDRKPNKVDPSDLERLVEAALKVDPKGPSGRHKNESAPKKPKPKKS